MPLDQRQVRQKADELSTRLAAHAPHNPTAARLQDDLSTLLAQARAGRLTNPVPANEVPGRRLFAETDLGNLRDLEQAYAEFRIAISGKADRYARIGEILDQLPPKPSP